MNTNFFDLVKHYAAVLRSNFRWVSCHVVGDGQEGITYRERSGREAGREYASPSRTMSASQVIAAGRVLEEGRRLRQ